VFNAAPGFYRYRLIGWALKQAGTLIGLVAGLVALGQIAAGDPPIVRAVLRGVELVGVAGFVAQLPFTFLMVRLDYRYRWYMVTDTTLRIREGLLRVREQTMTFANIQNLSIRQGPLQRLFGITDLRVRTAGGGQGGDGSDTEGSDAANMHLAYFRGVDNAEAIRDLVMDRMRGLRDAGLGDPDDVPDRPPAGEEPAGVEELRAAAHELLAASRELRTVIG
jgi:uncharacterized membrane protein YdbT with pleckstrin-like domain